MKILFVTTCYPMQEQPQYCIFLEQQALALKELGLAVDVYLLGDHSEKEDSDYLYHGICVFYRKIMKKTSKLNVLFPTELAKEDEAKLAKVMAGDYDAVSFHFGGLGCLQSVLKVCEKFCIPLIHHFHGLNIWSECYDAHRWLTVLHNGTIKKRLYSKLSATVNVSGAVKAEFEKRIASVPSYVVYNGVDIERFPFRKDRRFFEDHTIKVLCVANLLPLKGQKYLIEAAEKLSAQGIPIKLTFAGQGPDETALKQLAAEKKADADFVGYLPYDEIASLMRTQDIFCMPSFYEALGCVYLEAMSSGMITIGVKGQGIEEVIRDGENGFLVEPQSADAIVSVIRQIINMDRNELKTISMNGRKTAEQFTWCNSAAALEKVYREVIERERRP